MEFKQEKILPAILANIIKLRAEQESQFIITLSILLKDEDASVHQLYSLQQQQLYRRRLDDLKRDLYGQFGHLNTDELGL
jgi:hypothetical protein